MDQEGVCYNVKHVFVFVFFATIYTPAFGRLRRCFTRSSFFSVVVVAAAAAAAVVVVVVATDVVVDRNGVGSCLGT